MRRNIADSARLRRLLEQDRGAVAVEFVVVLPALILLLLLFVSSALHFALASDVQQLATELARAALPYANDSAACTVVVQLWSDVVTGSFPLLSPDRVVEVACRYDAAVGLAQIQVTYDTHGTPGSLLGRLVGLDVESIIRRGLVQV